MALKQEFEKQGNWLFIRRSFIPVAALVIGLLVYLQTRNDATIFVLWNVDFTYVYEIFCLMVSVAGLLVRVYAVGHTPANTSGRNTKEGQVADTVNTTGIYSTLRHPLYLGNYLMWLGIAMLTASPCFIIIFSLAFWLYYERIMFAEEQFLSRKFGEVYDKWSAVTPAFIPSLKNFKKPNLPFSWKKILKKEKNGVAALFLLFMLFDIIGKLSIGRYDFNKFYIISCAIALVAFGALTYIKRKTDWLEEKGR